jgi:hypothetical protein
MGPAIEIATYVHIELIFVIPKSCFSILFSALMTLIDYHMEFEKSQSNVRYLYFVVFQILKSFCKVEINVIHETFYYL